MATTRTELRLQLLVSPMLLATMTTTGTRAGRPSPLASASHPEVLAERIISTTATFPTIAMATNGTVTATVTEVIATPATAPRPHPILRLSSRDSLWSSS